MTISDTSSNSDDVTSASDDDKMDETTSDTENLTLPPLNKIDAAQFLPSVATYNMRSIFPKIGNVAMDLTEREISVGFFSEIWEKAGNKSHKY